MKVLVTAASRYGATAEIADAIAKTLNEHGLDAIATPPGQVTDLTGYDAVILGSAVYSGHWLDPAKEFAGRFAADLATRPVWLFSSGPVGDPQRKLVQQMDVDPVDLPPILSATGARSHEIFAGKLDRHSLKGLRRASLFFIRGLEGDFRDWDAIARWAQAIADELQAPERVSRTA